MERIDRIIDFAKEAEKFSNIKRAILTSEGREESDSEHVFQMMLLLTLIEKDLPKGLDFNRMIKLILIHDLPEIYSGDFLFSDKEARKDKEQKELEAAEKLFSKLPKDLEKEFIDLFLEYENRSSKEAKIVKAIDKLQPYVQEIVCKGKANNDHRLGHEEIHELNKVHITEDKIIKELYDKLRNELKEFLDN